MDDERRNPIEFWLLGQKGQGQLWHSVYETLWAQYRLQFLHDYKLHKQVVDDEEPSGQKSKSTLALCLWNLESMMKTKVFAQ